MGYIGARPTNVPLTSADIGDLPTSKITSGTFADARISSSSVTQHAASTDLQPLKADLTALALREATNEASAAFNLPSSFIETFTDDTNLLTQTTCDRQPGFMSTKIDVVTTPASASDWTGNTGSFTIASGSLDVTNGDDAVYSNWESGTGDFTISFVATSLYHAGGGARCGIFDKAEVGSFNQNNAIGGLASMTKSWHMYAGTGSNAQTGEPSYGSTTYSRFENRTGGDGFIHGDTYKFKRRSNVLTFTETPSGGGTELTVFTWTQQDNVTIHFVCGDNGSPYTGNWTSISFTAAGTTPEATGTLIQTANTVASAKTVVGGTMLYKDANGTATIGTDLKIYFSCDNGSNWTEASSYNAITPVYSTGVKQVRLGETTCTSGTGVIYKAVWANQGGSKETQLHGIGVNY